MLHCRNIGSGASFLLGDTDKLVAAVADCMATLLHAQACSLHRRAAFDGREFVA